MTRSQRSRRAQLPSTRLTSSSMHSRAGHGDRGTSRLATITMRCCAYCRALRRPWLTLLDPRDHCAPLPPARGAGSQDKLRYYLSRVQISRLYLLRPR